MLKLIKNLKKCNYILDFWNCRQPCREFNLSQMSDLRSRKSPELWKATQRVARNRIHLTHLKHTVRVLCLSSFFSVIYYLIKFYIGHPSPKEYKYYIPWDLYSVHLSKNQGDFIFNTALCLIVSLSIITLLSFTNRNNLLKFNSSLNA